MAVSRLRRFDLPLDQSAASRFLPWALAAVVYLAVVALGVAAIADGALRLYNMRAKLVTITLPSIEGTGDTETDLAKVVEILRNTPGVTSVTPVPREELEKLIEPWLGDAKGDLDLPLPRLIDITLDASAKPDLQALEQELRKVVTGASIGVEALARDRAERSAAFFRAWGSALGIALILGSAVVAALLTRLTVRMTGETVELLRCMGAPDRYLVRQFERHTLLSALYGSLVGLALAIPTLLALLYTGRRMELAGSIQIALQPLDWALLLLVPVICALLAVAAARLTALWTLRHST